MREVQAAGDPRDRIGEILGRRRGSLVEEHEPRDGPTTCGEQDVLEAEPPGLCQTPLPQDLAADVVPVPGLTLRQEHSGSAPGHHRGQRATQQSFPPTIAR